MVQQLREYTKMGLTRHATVQSLHEAMIFYFIRRDSDRQFITNPFGDESRDISNNLIISSGKFIAVGKGASFENVTL